MPKLRYEISDELQRKLASFKKVVNSVLEEEIPDDAYVDLVIDQGIKSMLGDIMPKDVDVLRTTIERISEANPEFLFDFVAEILKRGESINKASIKQKLGFIKNSA